MIRREMDVIHVLFDEGLVGEDVAKYLEDNFADQFNKYEWELRFTRLTEDHHEIDMTSALIAGKITRDIVALLPFAMVTPLNFQHIYNSIKFTEQHWQEEHLDDIAGDVFVEGVFSG